MTILADLENLNYRLKGAVDIISCIGDALQRKIYNGETYADAVDGAYTYLAKLQCELSELIEIEYKNRKESVA